jgi:hypothetical protein
MFRIKQDPDALDLTNQHLLSPTIDDDDEDYSGEDEINDCIPKVLIR